MNNIEIKAAVSVEDAEAGTGTAVIATLGVPDRENDVIEKGALMDGDKTVPVLPGHNSFTATPPMGLTKVYERGDELRADFRLNLKTRQGRDWFEHLKFAGEDQEWSFGFRVLKSSPGKRGGPRRIIKRMKVHEVSPVMMGAGVNTRTVNLKEKSPEDPDTERELMDVQAEITAAYAELDKLAGQLVENVEGLDAAATADTIALVERQHRRLKE